MVGVAKGQVKGDHAVVAVVVVVFDRARVGFPVGGHQFVAIEQKAIDTPFEVLLLLVQIAEHDAYQIGLQFDELEHALFGAKPFAFPKPPRLAIVERSVEHTVQVLRVQVPVFLKDALRFPGDEFGEIAGRQMAGESSDVILQKA